MMIQRFRVTTLLLVLTLPIVACQRQVDEVTAPLDQASFNSAVAAGGAVVIQFHAAWCPTCKQQESIVKDVMGDPRFKDVKLFVANFDNDKAAKKQLGVSSQSTFVVFKGGKEVARSTGQTTRSAIESTFSKAL